jgi:hypothetical protein
MKTISGQIDIAFCHSAYQYRMRHTYKSGEYGSVSGIGGGRMFSGVLHLQCFEPIFSPPTQSGIAPVSTIGA